MSVYILYLIISDVNESLARVFVVLATVPSYVVWISAAGLPEPLTYLLFALSFYFWIKYIRKKREEYALLSVFFVAIAFVIRPPFAFVWVVPGLYVFRKNVRLFLRAVLVFLSTVFLLGIVSLVLFGSYLPTVQYMLHATGSNWFNSSLQWYALCALYPFLVFGVLASPFVFVAYLRHIRDEISIWLLAYLLPYFVTMLLFAPKEPRYYTISVYLSAYVFAQMLLGAMEKLKQRCVNAKHCLLLFYFALIASSFFYIPGVCVRVEYLPVRTWTLEFPCLNSPFVADAQHKLDFVKLLCANQAEMNSQWGHIIHFMQRFYPNVCTT